MRDSDHATTLRLDSQTSDFSAHLHMADQAIGRMSKAMLVQVKKATSKGEVAAPGQVNVLPMVKMQDALGNVHSHGSVNNLPYFRLQSGTKGIIMDPKAGDIGLAIYADRDISAVKKNRKESQPGSFRQHDMADGMLFPSFLGDAPTCYIRFTDDNKIIISPDNGTTIVTIEAGKAQIKVGDMKFSMQSSRIDINGDFGEGSLKVMLDGGAKAKNTWGVPE